MPRKRKSGIDYWLENCFRCTNALHTHYKKREIDNGTITFKCKCTGEYVTPWYIDGCKKFAYGVPEEVTVYKNSDKDGENTS